MFTETRYDCVNPALISSFVELDGRVPSPIVTIPEFFAKDAPPPCTPSPNDIASDILFVLANPSSADLLPRELVNRMWQQISKPSAAFSREDVLATLELLGFQLYQKKSVIEVPKPTPAAVQTLDEEGQEMVMDSAEALVGFLQKEVIVDQADRTNDERRALRYCLGTYFGPVFDETYTEGNKIRSNRIAADVCVPLEQMASSFCGRAGRITRTSLNRHAESVMSLMRGPGSFDDADFMVNRAYESMSPDQRVQALRKIDGIVGSCLKIVFEKDATERLRIPVV